MKSTQVLQLRQAQYFINLDGLIHKFVSLIMLGRFLHYFLIFSLFIWAQLLFAQDDNILDAQRLENTLEQYIESIDQSDFDVTDLLERLQSLEKDPINLNTASAQNLSDLLILNAIEINAILNHRSRYGDFIALEELQTIHQLDYEKIKVISSLLTVSASDRNRYDFRDIYQAGQHTLFAKYKRVLQERKGYEPRDDGTTPYLGDPNHAFLRYRFDSGRALKAGFTMEKDPGEQFFTGVNRNGFDFYSAFVYAEGLKPWLSQLAIGDYSLNLGQGLILHNAFGARKSVYTLDIKKDGRPIRHYSSVNETNFFRGAAATFQPMKNVALTLFYSNKQIDGNLAEPEVEIDDFGSFSSIIRSGLHRTASEIEKKNAVNQINYGGRIEYTFDKLRVRLNHLTYEFERPLFPSESLYRLFNFRGDQLDNTSVDYSYRYKNINLFGEVSTSHNGGWAQVHGAMISLDRKVDLALLYRNYQEDYHTLESNAFSEGTFPINEEGIYLGIEIRPMNGWIIRSYVDYWRNPWLRFRIDAPYGGREFLFRIEHFKKRTYQVYLQYRYETKGRNSNLNVERIDPVVNIHNHRARLHFAYNVTNELEVRSRIEGSLFDQDGNRSNGILIYQDIIYKPKTLPLSMNARMALFDTDNFDNRIYTFENDLLYEFFIPFFQDRGMRSYLNFRYKIRRNLGWEFKIARTLLTNSSTIGSGNELIDGPARTEFKTQIKYTF